ncbi:MAG: hypothetical protein HVN35_07810 [Methanobacteriaceae archaeon]|nr:hypothetical protein [Methanobacteriaceae archaeon]
MKNNKNYSSYRPLTPEKAVISLVREWFKNEKEGDMKARERAQLEIKKYLFETSDGSYTLQSDDLGDSRETMHTAYGAYSEAKEKFVNPACLGGKKKVAILDICSGLGINSAAALDYILDSKVNIKVDEIKIDMVEISIETIAASLLIPSPSESHLIIKKAIETFLIDNHYLEFSHEDKKIPEFLNIQIHCTDAREMVQDIPRGKYDAIFLDPFSPAKSPELYTLEFLSILSSLLKDDGLILTYTAAAPVRYALIACGLEVGEGPAMNRSGGTIASRDVNKISKPLSSHDERMIALSDAGIPYRDNKLTDSSNMILERRKKDRIHARGNFKMASTVKTPIYLAQSLEEERTKRRVLNHLADLNISDINSQKAKFLVCPQFSSCICNCKQGRSKGSSARVKEMERRLKLIIKSN